MVIGEWKSKTLKIGKHGDVVSTTNKKFGKRESHNRVGRQGEVMPNL